jgi:hypothetical protein
MMTRVYWTFGIKQYTSYEEFIVDVTVNCEEISKDHDWVPDEYICHGPLVIEFELVWRDPPDDMIYFPITHSAERITQGILLFRLNNASYEYFRTDDHKFFERLGKPIDGKMYLVTGS